jgi:heptosyltransferase-2
MRILVIRLSSMGDVILSSAVLDYLHTSEPSADIDMVTGTPYAALFQDDPRLSRTIAYDRNAPQGACDRIRRREYDRVVDLQNSPRSRRLTAAARTAVIGRFDKKYLARTLLLLGRISLYRRDEDVVARYLRAAGWRGEGPAPVKVRLARPLAVSDFARAALAGAGGERLLGMIPFSAWPNKQWPLERYRDVAARMAQAGWEIVVFGGPDDRPAAEKLQESVGEACVSVAGRIPLDQSAAVLSQCRLVVGNDTGLTHMARAVGRPVAVVFGATTWHFGFYPSGGPAHRVLEVPLWCRPCNAHGGAVCLRGGRPCLTRISVDSVVEALQGLDVDIGEPAKEASVS